MVQVVISTRTPHGPKHGNKKQLVLHLPVFFDPNRAGKAMLIYHWNYILCLIINSATIIVAVKVGAIYLRFRNLIQLMMVGQY